jgi:HTH-type transcriptional regulator, glycine betaine synthesis regulator
MGTQPMPEPGNGNSNEQNTSQKLTPVLSTVNDSILDGLGQLADYFGYNRVMGKMYGALLLSPMPMSLDDLLNHLDVSKASVSMNMRMLENLGIVREVWVRGDRRKYYEAESDFWKIVTNVLGGRELREINQALSVLEANVEKLQDADPTMTAKDRELAQLYLERMEQIRAFFRFAKLVITSILERSNLDMGDVTRIDIE